MRVGELPSSLHARDFVRSPGVASGLVLGVDVLVRGLLIAAAIRALKPGSSPLRQGLAGSLGIEAFVLAFTFLEKSP